MSEEQKKSKQRRWQLKKRSLGKCIRCGKDSHGKKYCKVCAKKQNTPKRKEYMREYMRKKRSTQKDQEIDKMKARKFPIFCKSCGKRLMYRSDDGSENNGWNKFEINNFDEYTGKRKGARCGYRVYLFCPEWADFWNSVPRPQYSPAWGGHTVNHFNSSKMFNLKDLYEWAKNTK